MYRRDTKFVFIVWMVPVAILISGCTHVQLRRNSLGQAQSVHELQQQQVLDNLAMFAVNPDAVPYFTIAGAGTCSVTDQGNASTSMSWLRAGFQSIGLTLSANRLMQENFTLAPLNDPDKLARMRCAYQAAVGYQGSDCIDCCGLEQQWGDRKWDGRPESSACPDECSPRPGWFCSGCKGDVPNDACRVGCYQGTYVWVPVQGTDELARLTLTILDYATFVPGSPPTKTVTTTTKTLSDGKTESTVEETVVLPLTVVTAATKFAPSRVEALPGFEQPAPLRQNFFFPQPVPQVVIPLQ